MPQPLITILDIAPPKPWITLVPEAVARFHYPRKCLTYECPGRPHKGTLYMAIHTARRLPSELHSALHNQQQHKHFGDDAALAPHCGPTDEPRYLPPCAEPCISFHHLPALATIKGTSWRLSGNHPGWSGHGRGG